LQASFNEAESPAFRHGEYVNDRLTDEEELTPEEIAEIDKARSDIKDGKGIKAEDVWDELGV
jgi:hypothetical protein